MLQFEKKVWDKRGLCIGMDEVGRGAFAGPMAVGGVVFDPSIEILLENLPKGVVLRDSKKMTALQRARTHEWIVHHAIDYHVEYIDPEFIDKNGLTEATQLGFTNVADNLSDKYNITHLLIDAFPIKNHPIFTSDKQHAITKGEDASISIAAASIVAKDERDKLMVELAKKHPEYLWHKNKGYGTAEHREAIKKNGLSELHRKSWGS